MKVAVDQNRLSAELTALAKFSDAEPPAVTRVLFTDADMKARAWLKQLCINAGLTFRQDALCNIFARWQGSDPTLPADERTPARWFNTAAFATANQFTIGSASRNPVRGPSYRDVDLALMRRVAAGRERAVELRLEVFNLLNTDNFGAPAAQLGPASFGTITTALDPRVVQLAAKFWF